MVPHVQKHFLKVAHFSLLLLLLLFFLDLGHFNGICEAKCGHADCTDAQFADKQTVHVARIITQRCLLSLVQEGKCPASPHSVWKPVMSGTVTARDSWLLTVMAPLLSLPPGASTLWLSCQQRCANVLQQRLALQSKPLSHFRLPAEHDEVPGEQTSKPLWLSLSRRRTKPW